MINPEGRSRNFPQNGGPDIPAHAIAAANNTMRHHVLVKKGKTRALGDCGGSGTELAFSFPNLKVASEASLRRDCWIDHSNRIAHRAPASQFEHVPETMLNVPIVTTTTNQHKHLMS